jgi:lipopolysaccharide export system permease protein
MSISQEALPTLATVRNRPARGGYWRLMIVDRYLLREFVQTFLICFISLMGLFVVIDGFTKLDEFIAFAAKQSSLLAVMGEYYAYRALSFFDSTGHLLTLIAAMFTMTWIQRHNEMTALESAGIPKSRIIQPVIMAVVVIILARVANRELIIPAVREHLSHDTQDLGGSTGKPLRPRYDNETGVLLGGSGSLTFASERRIQKPDFYMPAGLNRYGVRLMAESAFYEPPQSDRPGGYRFSNLERPKGLETQPSLTFEGRAVLLTPRDYSWLKPGECFLVTEVSFEHLEATNTWRSLSSTAELIRGLRNRSLDFGVEERLAIHARLVQPLLDLTLLFLGLPLVLSRSQRNMFVAIGQCLALVIAFTLVVYGCQNVLGSNYLLEPALAAWLPLMIFIPCAVGLSQPLRE